MSEENKEPKTSNTLETIKRIMKGSEESAKKYGVFAEARPNLNTANYVAKPTEFIARETGDKKGERQK